MKIENWRQGLAHENAVSNGNLTINGDVAEISLSEGVYNISEVSCVITNLPDEKNYISFNMDIKTDGKAQIKYLLSWFRNEVEIFKEYINLNEKITPCKNADKVIFAVMVRGWNGGNVKVTLPHIEEYEEIKPRKVKVASISLPYSYMSEIKPITPEYNLEVSLIRIDALVKIEKPDLIVLTENFLTRRVLGPAINTYVKEDGPEMLKMRAKAKEHKIYLSFSVKIESDEGLRTNTAYLIDRNGEIAAKYDKTHYTMGELEDSMVPGDKVVVADTDFGKVGFAICWDLFFNDFIYTMRRMGAEIIINPTAGFHRDMNAMRAKDNGVYIVSAGVDGNKVAIFNPEGQVLGVDPLRGDPLKGYAMCEIDLNERFPVHYLSSGSWSTRKDVYISERRDDLYYKGK